MEHRHHRWITGDVHHKIEPWALDQIGDSVIDRHVDFPSPVESRCQGILVGNADDLNGADLMEHIEQCGASPARADNGHSHWTRGGCLLDFDPWVGVGRRGGRHALPL